MISDQSCHFFQSQLVIGHCTAVDWFIPPCLPIFYLNDILQKWEMLKKMKFWNEPVAHDCNSSYSGDRNQKDYGSKPSQANSSRDPILKIPMTKRAGGVAPGVGPEFKLQYHK
jgi:hypothetical protein